MFESVTQPTFRQILTGTSVIYRVPPFQRDYAWDENQWDDLWRDLESLSAARDGGEGSPQHYMGYLVMRSESPSQSPGGGGVWIIDGQQRMATLTILMLACAEEFGRLAKEGVNELENKRREEEVRRDHVGRVDLVTRRTVRRLRLNRNDDAFFGEYVLRGESPHSFVSRKRSNHLLWRALEFFRAKFRADRRSGEDVARLVNAASDGLLFTLMSVSSDLNAYQVFETLNARGTPLSQGDLVKNLLFQKAEDGERVEEMLELWDGMESNIGGMGVVDFLRCIWNSKQEYVRSEGLFRRLGEGIHGAKSAFEFATEALRVADIYDALQKPFEWRNDKDAQESVGALTFSFRARQHLPLLLAAQDMGRIARQAAQNPDDVGEKHRRAEFRKLLELVEFFHFRRGVISKASSTELESVYNRAALALRKSDDAGGLKRVEEVLKSADVTEEQFMTDFAKAEFDVNRDNLESSRIVRYILGKLERKMGGRADLSRATIEHILPRHPGKEWDEFFPPETRENYARRLGNYCLLSEGENNEADNLPYAVKKFIYEKSAYRTANDCGEKHPEWTPAALEERQLRLAARASEIWRL